MKSLFLFLLSVALPIGGHADPYDVYGLWLSEAKDGHIEISDCGDGSPCGILVWVAPEKEPTLKDDRNRDERLRDRNLIGAPVVWGYARGRSEWRGGKIYNPEDGKTFWSSMKRRSDGTLKVKGCLGPLCIANTWTRVKTDAET